MNEVEKLLDYICRPHIVPYGHPEDDGMNMVLKDVVILCDLIGVKHCPGGTAYSFKLPNGDIFELNAFEYKSMVMRYMEIIEEEKKGVKE